MRIIHNEDRYRHKKDFLKGFSIINVYKLKLFNISIFMCKIKIYSSLSPLNNIFERPSHSHATHFSNGNYRVQNQNPGSEEVSFKYQCMFQYKFINTSFKYMVGFCWKWRTSSSPVQTFRDWKWSHILLKLFVSSVDREKVARPKP